jgi:hypothetical protein
MREEWNSFAMVTDELRDTMTERWQNVKTPSQVTCHIWHEVIFVQRYSG